MEYQNAVHVDSLEGISGDVNEEDDQEEYNELEEFEKEGSILIKTWED